MIYRVSHRIRHHYSAAVFLEPHILRLQPRSGPAQQITSFTLAVTPQPSGVHDFLDGEGNSATCVWFDDLTDSLSLSTTFEVQTFEENAFQYLITDDSFLNLPVHYSGLEATILAPYLVQEYRESGVKDFAASIVSECGGRTLDFLFSLNTFWGFFPSVS